MKIKLPAPLLCYPGWLKKILLVPGKVMTHHISLDAADEAAARQASCGTD